MGTVLLPEMPGRASALFVEDEVPEEFGWFMWLTPSHQRLFAGELFAAAKSGASRDELLELLDGWKATAEMDRSPEIQQHIERNRGRRFETADEWRTRKQGTA